MGVLMSLLWWYFSSLSTFFNLSDSTEKLLSTNRSWGTVWKLTVWQFNTFFLFTIFGVRWPKPTFLLWNFPNFFHQLFARVVTMRSLGKWKKKPEMYVIVVNSHNITNQYNAWKLNTFIYSKQRSTRVWFH